jgi:hypothetical protein
MDNTNIPLFIDLLLLNKSLQLYKLITLQDIPQLILLFFSLVL